MRQHLYFSALTLLAACTGAGVPTSFSESDAPLSIYPDYQDVTIPTNMAPLTFTVENPCDAAVCRLSVGETEVVLEGPDICPSHEEWQRLKEGGNEWTAEVFLQQQGAWQRLRPFSITISPDSIDPYLAYRLISPGYIAYEDLTICQRDLTSYDEMVIYGNMQNATEEKGHCINCHSFQSYNPRRLQMHVRQNMGGTVIAYDGHVRKVNLRQKGMISSAVYPAWHPTLPLIAYSTNLTSQSFHTSDIQKIEVQDALSDLVLYDVEQDRITPLPSDSATLDCFPTWSPDGQTLYYCSANYEKTDSTLPRIQNMMADYEQIRYNIYRRPFDAKSHTFGERQLVYDAAADSMSATLPRISPDGRFLMVTVAPYGIFHIWHREADLRLISLQDGTCLPLDGINSSETESYHSWSSNGRWIVFSSRRDDGNYTRPFFAHIDSEGRAEKPFELPSARPLYHRELLRSYNVPEFISGKVEYELGSIIANDPE